MLNKYERAVNTFKQHVPDFATGGADITPIPADAETLAEFEIGSDASTIALLREAVNANFESLLHMMASMGLFVVDGGAQNPAAGNDDLTVM